MAAPCTPTMASLARGAVGTDHAHVEPDVRDTITSLGRSSSRGAACPGPGGAGDHGVNQNSLRLGSWLRRTHEHTNAQENRKKTGSVL